MYLGRQQLGTHLDVFLQTLDEDGVGTMPDAVPLMKVWLGSTLALAAEMPIIDKTIMVGLFRYPLFLGLGFTVGHYSIGLHYVVNGLSVNETRTFEVLPAGDQRGQVLSMYWLHRPENDQVIMQMESGIILRGKNPKIT